MRPRLILLITAAVLLAIAIVLLVPSSHGTEDEYGWFAYAPADDSVDMADALVVLTFREAVGWVSGWAATLLVAGFVGHRFANRRRPSA